MRYQSSGACRLLQPCVARFWQVESDGPLADSPGRWALPDGGSEWVFVLGDPLMRGPLVHRAGAHAAGIALTASLSRPAGRMRTLGVAFRPGGAAAVLRQPASELTGRVVPLDSLWGSSGSELVERLAEAPGFEERVGLLQQELLRRLRPTDGEVAEAVRRLAADPHTRVGRLAGDEASARRLERKFLVYVGIGPKRLARIFRLQRAVRLWATSATTSWAELAAVAGYSDQAHMVREFTELAGTSPTRIGTRAGRMSDFFNTEPS
jgi:AraC-like DNA-binding protein